MSYNKERTIIIHGATITKAGICVTYKTFGGMSVFKLNMDAGIFSLHFVTSQIIRLF